MTENTKRSLLPQVLGGIGAALLLAGLFAPAFNVMTLIHHLPFSPGVMFPPPPPGFKPPVFHDFHMRRLESLWHLGTPGYWVMALTLLIFIVAFSAPFIGYGLWRWLDNEGSDYTAFAGAGAILSVILWALLFTARMATIGHSGS